MTTVLESAPLPATDAIHRTAALVIGCDRFVPADRRKLAAARSLGLVADEV